MSGSYAPATSQSSGRLLLVPAPLEQAESPRAWLCEPDRLRVAGLRRFYVETPKVARAWLRAIAPEVPIRELTIIPLPSADEAASTRWQGWLEPLLAGESVALVSDAGCPGIADPGSGLVAAAHDAGIRVEPLIGPSAILLGLMASGLIGQRFAFHGYLPTAAGERDAAIGRLAGRAIDAGETQILIETPYRNQAMADSLLRALPARFRLAIAVDLTGSTESIRSRSVEAWRRSPPTLPRQPAVFLFGRGPH